MRIRSHLRWKPNPRTDAQRNLQSVPSPTDTDANPPVRVWLAAEQLLPPANALNLLCLCGHPRRDHRGLRLEISGACLDCTCEGFAPAHGAMESDEQFEERVRAALDRARRMEKIVATLRPKNGSPMRSDLSAPPPLSPRYPPGPDLQTPA
jgi:hypothetical protein